MFKNLRDDNTKEAQYGASRKAAELLASGQNPSRLKHLMGLEQWDEGPGGFGDALPRHLQKMITPDIYDQLSESARGLLEQMYKKRGNPAKQAAERRALIDQLNQYQAGEPQEFGNFSTADLRAEVEGQRYARSVGGR